MQSHSYWAAAQVQSFTILYFRRSRIINVYSTNYLEYEAFTSIAHWVCIEYSTIKVTDIAWRHIYIYKNRQLDLFLSIGFRFNKSTQT